MAPVPYSRMIPLVRPDVRPCLRPYILESCQNDLNKLYPTSFQQGENHERCLSATV